MDQLQSVDTRVLAETVNSSSEQLPSLAPPSSGLSDPPKTDPTEPASQTSPVDTKETTPYTAPQLSAQTEEILKRINSNAATAAATGTPGWEAAKEQIMRDMATSDKIPTPELSREASVPKRGGRGSKRQSADGDSSVVKMEVDTPSATPGRGRGRGRPSGRGRGGGRGGKRKREDRDDDGDSDSSEVITPIATMTKSGRNVQKPTAFVPPPQTSPTTGPNKRKRSYRKNPESAVCKVCLRGTSPASNMIVFCDGCNTPYHRHCHQPPIDQSVVDEVDKEWYCKACEKERVVPVPEIDVADLIAADGAPVEQRQRYFASLPQGMLITLLTRATTLQPDLPLFPPDFHAEASSSTAPMTQQAASQPSANGHAHPPPPQSTASAAVPTAPPSYPQASAATAVDVTSTAPGASFVDNADDEENDGYADHPPTYPRPGQGLMKTLPPEQEDLQWLVEDEDRFGVFSHMYQVDAQAANGGLNGGDE